MIREWFDATEAVAFASSITHDLHLVLGQGAPNRRGKKAGKKLDSILARTRAFRAQHDLNVYKKAKLLNTIKWGLREAGHHDAEIDEVVAMLAPLLS